MKIISEQIIKNLNISPKECVDWIKESFSIKKVSQLPAKISVHPQGDDFFTSMPCLLPPMESAKHQYFGIKIVHRIDGGVPSLGSDILLYDSRSGDLLAMLDGDWITTMRTGAVATLAAKTFRKSNAKIYGFIGLGNTARATLLCLLESESNNHFIVNLLKYKNQAELFTERFKKYGNVSFNVINNVKDLISSSEVLFSCVTSSPSLICEDDSAYPLGCTLIPVHTRGFQNCDLFFDRIFGDDTAHVKGFRYFNQFKYFAEISDVLSGEKVGRKDDSERILSYNIGLGLHDVLFAAKIYEKVTYLGLMDIPIIKESEKFWI